MNSVKYFIQRLVGNPISQPLSFFPKRIDFFGIFRISHNPFSEKCKQRRIVWLSREKCDEFYEKKFISSVKKVSQTNHKNPEQNSTSS